MYDPCPAQPGHGLTIHTRQTRNDMPPYVYEPTEESIARNVEKILEQLKGIETVRPLAVMRARKKGQA